ncbi:MAG: hypothetical protein J6X77_02870 [Bacteroidales bacterium]|nr:hypothetical protein [Bacteroidales bacterium]
MTTFVAAAIILGLGVLGMCVFLLKKGGEFPKYDVGSNPEMQKRGIRCFKDVDAELHAGRVKCDGNYTEACEGCDLFTHSRPDRESSTP